MSELRNLVSQAELKKRIEADTQPRTTLSFYQYHPIEDPQAWRDELYQCFESLGVLGRVYVAHEGINAQISVPTENFEAFKNYLYSFDFLSGIRLNIAVEDDGKSFWVLKIKVRPKIVADGIEDPAFSMENRGQYLKAEEFNELTARPETIVVDMRNYYEYEVGHFENAREVPSDTFREQLPMAAQMLQDDKDKPIVMYCTGGIRCEKASAYLKHQGFANVYHLEGGIIEYARQVEKKASKTNFAARISFLIVASAKISPAKLSAIAINAARCAIRITTAITLRVTCCFFNAKRAAKNTKAVAARLAAK